MVEINISSMYAQKWPDIQLGCIECDVLVEKENETLWSEVCNMTHEIHLGQKIEKISQIPAISVSRKAYKVFGKDPARYRLSAEALMRRVVKGYGLYRVNTVVDIVNLVSIKTGFSIGGYDFDKFLKPITLDIGSIGEDYDAIGRGEMNIESMPVLRDCLSAFGSPTSDSMRTSVDLATKNFFMVVFAFGQHAELPSVLNYTEELLKKYTYTKSVSKYIIK
jgi:DNA/RNA-binding domain of Phe-tRNA-synthetase-like protein